METQISSVVTYLHLSALAFCLLGCCCMFHHANAAWRLSAIIMIVSMTDQIAGPHLIPSSVWSLVLATTSLMIIVEDFNWMPGPSYVVEPRPERRAIGSTIQMSLGPLAMAVMMPLMPGSGSDICSQGGQISVGALIALWGTAAIYTCFTLYALPRLRCGLGRKLEAAAMVVSLGLMSTTGVLHS